MKSLIISFLALISGAVSDNNFSHPNSLLDDPVRIIEGKPAFVGQFPYQVGLSIRNRTRYIQCGGSLISSEWVLTAAHCLQGWSSAEVRLGGIYWQKPEVSFIVDSSNFIIHENFMRFLQFRSDIALIKIPRVEFTDNIQKAKLPNSKERAPTYTGKKVIVSGWGIIDDNQHTTEVLLYAKMGVITNFACSWETAQIIFPNHICARPFKGGNTCNGDSGGPMVLSDSKILIGVTSFGSEKCEAGYPSVYTRVTSYLDWIEYHTGIKF